MAYLAAGEGGSGGAPKNALGKELQPPVPGHWHDEAHFWSGLPVIEKRYSVRVPKDKPLQYEVYNGELVTSARFDGDHVVYTFVKEDIEPFKGEPSMEARPNVACKLLLATLPDWESKSRWLYSVSEPQLEANDEIRAKVAEVIKGCKTDEEKYTALNHWVAENVRYAGTTRGMAEGYTIHDIKETFRDRLGVWQGQGRHAVRYAARRRLRRLHGHDHGPPARRPGSRRPVQPLRHLHSQRRRLVHSARPDLDAEEPRQLVAP